VRIKIDAQPGGSEGQGGAGYEVGPVVLVECERVDLDGEIGAHRADTHVTVPVADGPGGYQFQAVVVERDLVVGWRLAPIGVDVWIAHTGNSCRTGDVAYCAAMLAKDARRKREAFAFEHAPPDGDGPIQSMRSGLADAGATPADIDYINAHGTSTSMNDKSESAAIRAVFGADTARVSVSSTKSTMGHLIAAAGAVEVVACALAIHHGEMPVNANLVDRDPDCDLNFVVGAPRKQRVRMTLSNSFGFGGSNSCIVLRHPDEVEAAAARRG